MAGKNSKIPKVKERPYNYVHPQVWFYRTAFLTFLMI